MERIVGREKELKELRKRYESESSEFVAIYGRRRVGKTFLIRNAFEQPFDFYLTGMANVGLKKQLANFHLSITRYDHSELIKEPADNWLKAFHQLSEVLEAQATDGKKQVIFLDELPWMDTPKSGFISALEYFWNSWASARSNILLIVCGSAASWMINKLIHNRGGLYNRITCRIKLEPFSLLECEQFFSRKNVEIGRFQIVQYYMAMGGIPFYLKEIDTSLSAAQNIQALFFETNGILYKEFDQLFRSLFANAEKHIAIIGALSQKSSGLTRTEIIEAIKLTGGGGITRILRELEESNFIRKYTAFGKKEKSSLYQLTDLYSLFYLKFIAKENFDGTYNWLQNLDNPKQRTWAGYAFEQVCLAHVAQIKQALGIGGVLTQVSAWLSGNDKQRAQVDLVIDRRDGVINLCEMKFSINPYTIDKKYADELRSKIGIFKSETNTRKAVYLTMITSFGLSRNMHANSLVQNDLSMDALFQ
ncbi:hypothetical protein SAMN05216436_1234 [bacterium A37T11]|nr:hypothetical protein SAMN05216436_1234 [bacterium A37T11]